MSNQGFEIKDKENLLLVVKDLKKHFPMRGGFFTQSKGLVKAVDGVFFYIRPGETLGLVGESGCGKTTTGRMVVRVVEPTHGNILYKKRSGEWADLAQMERHEVKPLRRDIQMIFQDPYASLDPRMTILRIIGEPLSSNGIASGKELEERVAYIMQVVGLRPEYMSRYPHAFSGGQRQRIGIARALVSEPRLVVADEPVSALDVSIQAQILNLLQDLQNDFNLTYLFVAHDLSVVRHISDRVAVMYVGKLVESATKKELFSGPKHPYTEALLSSVPRPDPRRKSRRIILAGEVADPANPPTGCYFHPRCRYAQPVCVQEEPILQEISPDHFVACHFASELSLEGV
jgi:peptide/nickel transport system ATP-binding protein